MVALICKSTAIPHHGILDLKKWLHILTIGQMFGTY